MPPPATPYGAAADGSSRLVRAAERMVSQIETLVQELATLKATNASLRAELREALDTFEKANAALAIGGRRRATPANGRRRRRRQGGPAPGRSTPASVTPEVVRAVLAKLGQATAAEIAAEITTAGVAVSGRAVRFLAEAAGAETFVGEDGSRRYRLP